MGEIQLDAKIRRSEPGQPRRTAGKFSRLINENTEVFQQHFGCELFPGSLNIDIENHPSIQADLDQGVYQPAVIVPRSELVGMPGYIGDGQAWNAYFEGANLDIEVNCWVFRRIGSRVPYGVLELISPFKLSEKYGLKDGDPIRLTIRHG